MNTITDSRQINLSSSSADTYINGTTLLSHMSFDFPGLLKDEPDILYKQISINNCQIPVSFYVINEYNNLLYYSIGGSILTLTFPFGNYNATTFISTFKSLMLGWDCTLNKLTGLLTFSYVSDFTLYTSSLYKLLGFIGESSTSSSNSITTTHLCDFSGVRRLSIRSNILRLLNRDSSTGNYTNDIQVIPVNQPAYGIIKFENISGFKNLLQNQTLDQIDISIYDDDNNLVDLNGVNWNITLQLDIIRKLVDNSNVNINQSINNLISVLTQPSQDQPSQDPRKASANWQSQYEPEDQPVDQLQEDPQIEEITDFKSPDNDLDLLMFQQGINI